MTRSFKKYTDIVKSPEFAFLSDATKKRINSDIEQSMPDLPEHAAILQDPQNLDYLNVSSPYYTPLGIYSSGSSTDYDSLELPFPVNYALMPNAKSDKSGSTFSASASTEFVSQTVPSASNQKPKAEYFSPLLNRYFL